MNDRRGPAARRPRRQGGPTPVPLGASNAVRDSSRRPASRRWACAVSRRRRGDLCGARPRHQQLPALDRAAHFRRLSRRRRVLPHHPARRGHRRVAPHQRCGDRARGRSAAGVPRQDAGAWRHAGEADRHRGLPGGGERRGVPQPRRRAGGDRARDHRFRDRSAACGDRLHRIIRSRGLGRHPVRYRRRLVRTGASRPPRCGPARAARTGHHRLGIAAGRRGHAWPSAMAARRCRAKSTTP